GVFSVPTASRGFGLFPLLFMISAGRDIFFIKLLYHTVINLTCGMILNS
ncbi:unnamed protein product, partial [Lymnaea stagnalis]